MEVVKQGRKWIVTGEGDGWVFRKTFPTKWKAEVAATVFKAGGRWSDYCRAAREEATRRPAVEPVHAVEIVERALDEIRRLDPTCEEIVAYGQQASYGEVTFSDSKQYFPPRLHDTWGLKRGGRVHIDMGCSGYHLMLDKHGAAGFIEFIKTRRGNVAE